ncbi:hypothetical protein SAMN06272735_8482 [Streptomyces sp. TLI_55]|uniref:hypothetical protein n=1 Tax=Streptomyces sp. TLI_55 TaxID=1938861 RepID=UPI000BD0819D|nr:hypothetical protein [Streptomyces sp. TLI_55]SNX66591.1 hypothetical protein SAMN06272735_8482 [Streptomyces sp. TLI_55]
MNPTSIGVIMEMALAFAGLFGGFAAFPLVGALGLFGRAAGRWGEGGGSVGDVRDAFERSRR